MRKIKVSLFFFSQFCSSEEMTNTTMTNSDTTGNYDCQNLHINRLLRPGRLNGKERIAIIYKHISIPFHLD